jgi:hypothetical protein
MAGLARAEEKVIWAGCGVVQTAIQAKSFALKLVIRFQKIHYGVG